MKPRIEYCFSSFYHEKLSFLWWFKARHKTKARSFEQYPTMKTLLSKRRNCYHAFETSDYCCGCVYGERRFLPANNGRPPTADAEFPSPLSLTLRIRLSNFPKWTPSFSFESFHDLLWRCCIVENGYCTETF